MKSIRVIATLAIGLALGSVMMHADDAKPAKARCCAKKEAAGEKCTHECCVAAAKDGKACDKCGGKK